MGNQGFGESVKCQILKEGRGSGFISFIDRSSFRRKLAIAAGSVGAALSGIHCVDGHRKFGIRNPGHVSESLHGGAAVNGIAFNAGSFYEEAKNVVELAAHKFRVFFRSEHIFEFERIPHRNQIEADGAHFSSFLNESVVGLAFENFLEQPAPFRTARRGIGVGNPRRSGIGSVGFWDGIDDAGTHHQTRSNRKSCLRRPEGTQ